MPVVDTVVLTAVDTARTADFVIVAGSLDPGTAVSGTLVELLCSSFSPNVEEIALVVDTTMGPVTEVSTPPEDVTTAAVVETFGVAEDVPAVMVALVVPAVALVVALVVGAIGEEAAVEELPPRSFCAASLDII